MNFFLFISHSLFPFLTPVQLTIQYVSVFHKPTLSFFVSHLSFAPVKGLNSSDETHQCRIAFGAGGVKCDAYRAALGGANHNFP